MAVVGGGIRMNVQMRLLPFMRPETTWSTIDGGYFLWLNALMEKQELKVKQSV